MQQPPSTTPDSPLDLVKLLGPDSEQEFDDIAELAAAICGTPISAVTLLDESWQYHKGSVGTGEDLIPRSQSFCQHTIRQEGVFVVRAADTDPRFESNPLVIGKKAIRFYAGAPVYSPDGTKVGALCVLDTVPRDLREGQIHALTLLARQVNARFELRAQRQRAAAALQSAQLRGTQFATFANNIPFICYIKDSTGQLVFCNEATTQSFGLAENAKGKTSHDLWGVETAEEIRAGDREVLERWQTLTAAVTVQDRTGRVYEIKLTRTPFISESGEPMIAGFALDTRLENATEREYAGSGASSHRLLLD